jgi:melibiose permease/lactose/raffinose/galactose permease
LIFAVFASLGMCFSQFLTVFWVKEINFADGTESKTLLKDLFFIIIKNDQLLIISVVNLLFVIASFVTSGLGLFYFKYVYGDEGYFSIYSLIIGITQILFFILFPCLRFFCSKFILFSLFLIMIFIGDIILLLTASGDLVSVCIAGAFIFGGTSSSLMIIFIFFLNSIDYGHLKLNKRNDSVIISVMSFVNKMGVAIANGIIGIVIIFSNTRGGFNVSTVNDNTSIIKYFVTLFPFCCSIAGYLIYLRFFKINEKVHSSIVVQLNTL